MASVLGRSKGVEAARGGATTTLLAWLYTSCNMFSHFPIQGGVNIMKTSGSPKFFWQDPFGDVLAKKSHPLGDFWSPSGNIKNLGFPIVGPKIKVVVDPSSDLSKQARERHQANGKNQSSIGLTSSEKNPKNPPKPSHIYIWAFLEGFWDFSPNW